MNENIKPLEALLGIAVICLAIYYGKQVFDWLLGDEEDPGRG